MAEIWGPDSKQCNECRSWELLEEDDVVGGHGACHHPLGEAQHIAFTSETAPGGLSIEGACRACRLFEQKKKDELPI